MLKSAGLTRRRVKKLDAIAQVHEQRRDHKSERVYTARLLVLCGIPVRRSAKSSVEYSRHNSRFTLRVIGHPDYGLPFGQDRLPLIWIATMATGQKNREIRFRSAAAILETFGLPKDGRYYKRLIAGFERILYATFFFSRDQQFGQATAIERQSFRFVKDAKLWYAESQLGISAKLRDRDFRRQIVRWLKIIRQLWPECPASLTKTVSCVLIKPAKCTSNFSTTSRESESGDHVTGFAENT